MPARGSMKVDGTRVYSQVFHPFDSGFVLVSFIPSVTLSRKICTQLTLGRCSLYSPAIPYLLQITAALRINIYIFDFI